MINVDLWLITMTIGPVSGRIYQWLGSLGKNMPMVEVTKEKRVRKQTLFPYRSAPRRTDRLIIALLIRRFVAGVNFYNDSARFAVFFDVFTKKTALKRARPV